MRKTRSFTYKAIELSKQELADTKAADLSPLARKILLKSEYPLFRALAGDDPIKADDAARQLAKKHFKIL